MKKNILYASLLFSILIVCGCKKNSTSSTPPAATAKCKPLTESSNLVGNNVTYTYTYNTDGTLANIKYPPYNMAIVYNATSITYPSGTAGLTDSSNTSYTGNVYTGSPATATVFLTIGAITYRNYMIYTFSYDSKSRLAKVIETTPNVATDAEYQLTIIYNDQDNVSQLKYESYNGPSFLKVISATGYDDKPNPYGAIKNWHLFMHAAWNNYDPGPILEALSKNNPLGYNITGDGVNASTISRTMAYTYNNNGFPLKRVNTNTNNAGTYSFEEIYTYQCE
jgi:hypothetical protein